MLLFMMGFLALQIHGPNNNVDIAQKFKDIINVHIVTDGNNVLFPRISLH